MSLFIDDIDVFTGCAINTNTINEYGASGLGVTIEDVKMKDGRIILNGTTPGIIAGPHTADADYYWVSVYKEQSNASRGARRAVYRMGDGATTIAPSGAYVILDLYYVRSDTQNATLGAQNWWQTGQASGATADGNFNFRLRSKANGLQTVIEADAANQMLEFQNYDVAIDALSKLYLDGGSNTYIVESAGDTISFFANSWETIKMTASGVTFKGWVQVTSTNGPLILNEDTSATNPVFCTDKGTLTTGLGGAINGGGLDLIVGSTSMFNVLSTGAAKLGSYGSGTFTGTATYWLAVDSSGNITEETVPVGEDNTVDKSGSPQSTYIAFWDSTSTITGDSLLTYGGGYFTVDVNLRLGNADAITTTTTAGHTYSISARDTDGASETPFITLTAGTAPTCDLDTAVTKNSAQIPEISGTPSSSYLTYWSGAKTLTSDAALKFTTSSSDILTVGDGNQNAFLILDSPATTGLSAVQFAVGNVDYYWSGYDDRIELQYEAEIMIKATGNAGVDLYYNNSPMVLVTSTGVTIDTNVKISGDEVATDINSYFDFGNGYFLIGGNTIEGDSQASSRTVLQVGDSGGTANQYSSVRIIGHQNSTDSFIGSLDFQQGEGTVNDDSPSQNRLASINCYTYDDTDEGQLNFRTNDGTAMQNVMTMDGNQYVGVGYDRTDTIPSLFSVNGAVTFTSGLTINDGTTTFVNDTSVTNWTFRSEITGAPVNLQASLRMHQKTSASALVDGYGPGIEFCNEDASSGIKSIAIIGAVRDSNDAYGTIEFWTYGSGGITNQFSFAHDGGLFCYNLASTGSSADMDYLGTGEVTYVSSDLRLKDKVVEWNEDALSILKRFDPKQFIFKNEPDRVRTGYIAQEGYGFIPDMFPIMPKTGYHAFNSSEILPYFHRAIIQVDDEVTQLKRRVKQLENEVKKLKAA